MPSMDAPSLPLLLALFKNRLSESWHEINLSLDSYFQNTVCIFSSCISFQMEVISPWGCPLK